MFSESPETVHASFDPRKGNVLTGMLTLTQFLSVFLINPTLTLNLTLTLTLIGDVRIGMSAFNSSKASDYAEAIKYARHNKLENSHGHALMTIQIEHIPQGKALPAFSSTLSLLQPLFEAPYHRHFFSF